jgi:hypothetical protein
MDSDTNEEKVGSETIELDRISIDESIKINQQIVYTECPVIVFINANRPPRQGKYDHYHYKSI